MLKISKIWLDTRFVQPKNLSIIKLAVLPAVQDSTIILIVQPVKVVPQAQSSILTSILVHSPSRVCIKQILYHRILSMLDLPKTNGYPIIKKINKISQQFKTARRIAHISVLIDALTALQHYHILIYTLKYVRTARKESPNTTQLFMIVYLLSKVKS